MILAAAAARTRRIRLTSAVKHRHSLRRADVLLRPARSSQAARLRRRCVRRNSRRALCVGTQTGVTNYGPNETRGVWTTAGWKSHAGSAGRVNRPQRRPIHVRRIRRGNVTTGDDTPSLGSLVARVRGEYCEMPGLRLTFAQACRLWQVETSTCERLLEQLVREGFLSKTDNGVYIVATSR